MQATHTIIRLAAAALLASAAAAGAQESTVKRIARGGADGARTFYTVNCVGGERASVFVKHATEEVCAVGRNGKPRCEKDGAVRAAAERACRATAR